MPNSTTAYLGLGANLGDPVQQLVDARRAILALPGSISGRCSSMYLSSPVGYDDQPNFLNCVLELNTRTSALALLDQTQSIENHMGRQRVAANQNAPRVIDIDLLLFGDQRIDSKRLSVPHPRLHQRLFVLQPLIELTNSAHYKKLVSAGQFTDQVLHQLVIAKRI